MNGFVDLIKPCGMSSSDAVFRVRRALGLKSCGHMGTLDPGAAGVLPVAVGKSARLFDYLLDKRKRYRAVFRFGLSTDTLDSFGTVTARGGRLPSEEELLGVLPSLTGEILQRAPIYSAKKINGKKGYELARAGREYEPPEKRVTVYSIGLVRRLSDAEYEFDIECGGGTYVRSIARDLASALGTHAFMQRLLRTQSGCFRLEDGVTVEELEAAAAGAAPSAFAGILVPPDAAVADYPRLDLPEAWYARFDNGVPYAPEDEAAAQTSQEGAVFRVYCRGEFFGMGAFSEGVVRLRSRIKEDARP